MPMHKTPAKTASEPDAGSIPAVSITPTRHAGKRTKERLKAHGPMFMLEDERPSQQFDGRTAVLIRSIKTDWLGWIRSEEVSIENC